MDEIDAPDEEERDAHYQEKQIVDIPAGIPDDDEDREGNGNAGEFNDAVKEEVIYGAYEVKGTKDNCDKCNLKEVGGALSSFRSSCNAV